MSKEKWVESLLDDMVESQWSEDIIRQEYESFSKLVENDELKSIEDLEPINQFSKRELNEQDDLKKDFAAQIESFSKSDYEEYLISKAVYNIREDEHFEEIEFSDEYLESLIKEHLEEENDFLDMVMKEAIAEDDYFQDYVERRLYEDYYPDYYERFDQNDFYVEEYPPAEKEVFDDLGDTSYMDQGIYCGENTDGLEEPFEYTYYEQPFFEEDLLDYGIDEAELDEKLYERSSEFVDVNNFPDDLILEEPADDNLKEIIRERLFEEKYLDRIFVEIIKKEDYWDKIIKEKLASDEKFNAKIGKFS